jgi:hypothetical protein
MFSGHVRGTATTGSVIVKGWSPAEVTENRHSTSYKTGVVCKHEAG